MKPAKWIIRQKYIDMIKRYDNAKELAVKVQMKHKFIEWLRCNHNNLTDAELEYLQESICYVEDIYY